MDYLCVATFRKVGIERRIELSLKDSLYDLALLLFGSLVCTEALEDYQFEFVFGEDRYITRKDEQESLFGYSTDHYHILDDETLQNAIVRKAASACFKIFSCGRLKSTFRCFYVEQASSAKNTPFKPFLRTMSVK